MKSSVFEKKKLNKVINIKLFIIEIDVNKRNVFTITFRILSLLVSAVKYSSTALAKSKGNDN